MSSPLEDYNQDHSERWKVLVDIPEWVKNDLFNWLYGVFVKHINNLSLSKDRYNAHIIGAIERRNFLIVNKATGIDTTSWANLRDSLNKLVGTDSRKVIFFLELVVKYLRDSGETSVPFYGSQTHPRVILKWLDKILENGSLWAVVFEPNSVAGLTERVDQRLKDVAKTVNNTKLAEAWALAFRPTPRPQQAIWDAQSAIESVASRHNLTTATSKVYGTLLGDIKARKGKSYVSVAKPAFDLSNALAGEKSNEVDVNDQFAEWFATGLNLIQKSNPGHHSSNHTDSFQPSPETAKQAVLIATLLCYLIKEGYITKLHSKTAKTPQANSTTL